MKNNFKVIYKNRKGYTIINPDALMGWIYVMLAAFLIGRTAIGIKPAANLISAIAYAMQVIGGPVFGVMAMKKFGLDQIILDKLLGKEEE